MMLIIFKNAIARWNTMAADSLPSCMRSCFKALYTITTEIADMVEEEHGMNPVNHFREAVCYCIVYLIYTLFNITCIIIVIIKNSSIWLWSVSYS